MAEEKYVLIKLSTVSACYTGWDCWGNEAKDSGIIYLTPSEAE